MYHPESDSLFEVHSLPPGAAYDPDWALCVDVTGSPDHETRYRREQRANR